MISDSRVVSRCRPSGLWERGKERGQRETTHEFVDPEFQGKVRAQPPASNSLTWGVNLPSNASAEGSWHRSASRAASFWLCHAVISQKPLWVFTHFGWVKFLFSPTKMGENALLTHFLKKWVKNDISICSWCNCFTFHPLFWVKNGGWRLVGGNLWVKIGGWKCVGQNQWVKMNGWIRGGDLFR